MRSGIERSAGMLCISVQEGVEWERWLALRRDAKEVGMEDAVEQSLILLREDCVG